MLKDSVKSVTSVLNFVTRNVWKDPCFKLGLCPASSLARCAKTPAYSLL